MRERKGGLRIEYSFIIYLCANVVHHFRDIVVNWRGAGLSLWFIAKIFDVACIRIAIIFEGQNGGRGVATLCTVCGTCFVPTNFYSSLVLRPVLP